MAEIDSARTLTVVSNGLQVRDQTSALPQVADVMARMAWMTEMRPVMRQYIEQHMDPARHMYSFENNRYTPLSRATLGEMLAEGKKPALNQDGVHNLLSLFDCYADVADVLEERDTEQFYHCRVTVRFISFSSGKCIGVGTGSCTTRESKYAYRWLYTSEIPKGTDRSLLKSRTFTGRNGNEYTRYRMDNEDIADQEPNVLQMAIKRAKSSGVKALPLVSEMFATLGDPDEEKVEGDERRQHLLTQLGTWLRGMKVSTRTKAILAIFSEPLRMTELGNLDEERLRVALQLIEIATKQKVSWESPTLTTDLKTALATSAKAASADLFGDPLPTTNRQTGEIIDVNAMPFDQDASAALDRELAEEEG